MVDRFENMTIEDGVDVEVLAVLGKRFLHNSIKFAVLYCPPYYFLLSRRNYGNMFDQIDILHGKLFSKLVQCLDYRKRIRTSWG